MSEKDTQEMIAEIDANGDGFIDYEGSYMLNSHFFKTICTHIHVSLVKLFYS